jgi:SNF2 family DNA or RNA helicase
MTLRPYQEVGRDWLAARTRALLADEMRVGKTPQAILAAHKIGAKKILVVCPAIGVTHWELEFERWWPGIASSVCRVSYDRAKLDVAKLLAEQWDVVIVDECHLAKNPEAQRTKLIYGKGGLGWHTKRLWALSGTPAPKHAGELWPLLRAFGVVGQTYSAFLNRYCYFDWTGKLRGTKESMIPELRGLLSKVMLRRTRKEVAPEMPAIDYQFLEVELSAAVDLRLAAEITYHERYPTAFQADRIAVANAKALGLADQITFALENELLTQTVVFGWHVEPLVRLKDLLEARNVHCGLINGATSQAERARIQAEFTEGRLQVICANILTAGVAIDLSAARHAYMLELDWVPGNNVQACNRLVNMEKLDKVTVDVVTAPGTVDDRVQRVLMRRVKELSKLY